MARHLSSDIFQSQIGVDMLGSLEESPAGSAWGLFPLPLLALIPSSELSETEQFSKYKSAPTTSGREEVHVAFGMTEAKYSSVQLLADLRHYTSKGRHS